MINWDLFPYLGLMAIACSLTAAILALIPTSQTFPCASTSAQTPRNLSTARGWAVGFSILGILALATFIGGLWISLSRPPLRTMGETRLWYSFFAMIAGLFTYIRWKYNWILSFSTVLASVFVLINILKPEIHDQTLMPALQSPWFIPHVTVYMFSYSFLGCAFLLALYSLFVPYFPKIQTQKMDPLSAADTLIYIGMAFLTFGMLSGALWAKQAWGHYWNWDPKETWALITWLGYMLYIHLRLLQKTSRKTLCFLLIFCFLCLQMCWWGVNYLPTAQDSIHVYNK